MVDGVAYELDTGDLIGFNVLFAGGQESSLTKYLVGRIGAANVVVWDVGANIGAVSLPIARRAPNAVVHSFEPSPVVLPHLLRNVAANPALSSRVHVHPWALSNVSGETSFFVSNEKFNSGVGGLGHSHNRTQRAVSIRCWRGDDLLSAGEIPRPDFIKIDVEGFEIEALRGCEALLRSAEKPLEIVFEHCLYRLEERKLPRTQVVDYLRELGFELFAIEADGERVRPFSPGDLTSDTDLVARRR
jgi:FkbM family methyltransferase